MTNICPKCGVNMDMVGRSHRCIARAPEVTTGDVVTVAAGKSTYRYRDPDKWRGYMRDYMRRRRAV